MISTVSTTPHWLSRSSVGGWPGDPVGRIGLGDATSTSISVASNLASQYGITVPTDIPSAAQAAYGTLPASVQNLVQQGMTAYTDLQPAVQLASAIASGGGQVNPQMIIGALSAAATVFGGPIAGAVIGTAGEAIQLAGAAMQSLFDALGLYDHPPTVQFVGLIPEQSVPAGPRDPQWIHINTPTDLYNYYNKLGSMNVIGLFPNGTWELYWWFQWCLGYLNPGDVECQHGWPGCGQGAGSPYSPNAFDLYFAHLLKADLEAWANGNPYMPPRQLLYSALTIWNATHQNTSTITYPAQDHVSPMPPGVSLISMLLGAQGAPDYFTSGIGHRADPITVNMGASVIRQRVVTLHLTPGIVRATAQTPSGSTTEKVVAGTAVVAGAGILGAAIYGWAKGEAISAVLKGAWRKVTGR